MLRVCKQCGKFKEEFHHLDSSEKEDNIAELVLSRKRMEEEMKKCKVTLLW